MTTDHCVCKLWACGLVVVAAAVAARADDPDLKARSKRWDQQFQESLSRYQVFADPNTDKVIRPESVFRWINPTRGQEGEPTLILWADAGRPLAQASVYPWNGILIHECVSLSRGVGLTVRHNGAVLWSPASAGVTFHDVPDAPSPAATATSRLSQIKALADRFKVTMTGLKANHTDREEMRLLPKPIYRYKLTERPAAHPDLLDGAVFAFVQGTDPEALLLIEAVRRGDDAVWQYAFARATAAGLEARLGQSIVWTAPRTYGANNPKATTIIFGWPLAK